MLPQIPIDDREIASATFHFKIAVVEVCLHPVATKWVIAHTGCSRSTGKSPMKMLILCFAFINAST